MVDVALSVSRHHAVFAVGDTEVGTYVLDDPFKPYLHPLRTPAGHVVSLVSPHDHRHHKGLMYGLKTRDSNFWEEFADDENPRIGRQVQTGLDFDLAVPSIKQRLSWVEDGGVPVFSEDRAISCGLVDEQTVRWTWRTRITTLHDTRLEVSPWAMPAADGHLINYHGLGLRFARSIGPHANHMTVFTDDGEKTVNEVHGQPVPRLGVIGGIDGYWEFPRAGVSVRQLTTSDTFFLLSHDFTSLSVGPSTWGPVDLVAGQTIAADYEIDVFDAPAA